MKKVFTLFLLLLCVATGWAGVDPTPTTNIESGTYVIKAFSDKNETGGYVFLNNSNAYADANTKNFEELIYKIYLWTVTKNTDGSITITSFSDATKSFPANPSNTQTFTLGSTAGSYTLQSAGDSYPNCFYLKIGSHFVHSNGTKGNNNNLGFWNGSGNSAVKACFYKATTDKVNVTYKYTHNGNLIKTVTGQWGGGFPYPKLLEIPDYVTSTLPEGTVPNEDVTKEIPVTWDDMPFKENQWYFVKLGCVENTTSKNGYLYDKNDNATRIDMGVTTKELSTTNYLWKFEGDPLNGYTLTSANGHKLVTPTVSGNGGTTFAYAASNAPTNGFDTWVAYKPTSTDITNNKGFFLAVKDHATWKLNSRDVTSTQQALSFWTEGADKGSAIFVDATLPEIRLNTLNDKNYATYYLPFAAKAPEGVTAYAGTINNGNVQLTEYANGVIPANKGVVLVSDTKTTATFTLADESEVAEQKNDLKGVLTETGLNSVESSDQVRIFSKKDNVAGFYKPNSNITTLAANKAYIMAPTNEGALVLNFAGGEVTGINQATINATEANAPIYDLTGRRVAKAVKGIYVKNGKKFIVK